jgi:hypothetical protein
MAKTGFNSVVAARTRAADQILGTADLVDKFEQLGGLQRDLLLIRDAGREAEAANLGQSQAKSGGKVATVDVLSRFADLQREYSAVMAVVNAVCAELVRTGADPDLIVRVKDILRNEAPLTVKTVEIEGEKKRKTTRSKAQEALRAEIAKDAGAILELSPIHPRLAERKVPVERLAALRDAAEELAGLLGSRTAAQGAAKTATQDERDAVARQRDAWGAAYRLLASLAGRDERVRSLLAQAKAS